MVLERDGMARSLIVFQLFVSLSLSMGRFQGFLVVHEIYDEGIFCLRYCLCW